MVRVCRLFRFLSHTICFQARCILGLFSVFRRESQCQIYDMQDNRARESGRCVDALRKIPIFHAFEVGFTKI